MFEGLKNMISRSVVAKYVWDIFKRFGFDIAVVVIGVWVLWVVYAGVLRPSQEVIVKTVLLYSLANIVWYGSRRLFVGKIDWSSDGDKWRKVLAIVMLVGAYLIFSRA
jgi:hypothetical protein